MCLRCTGEIAKPEPRVKLIACRRCGHRSHPDHGFVAIHFSEGHSALEQLRNGRVVYICDECGELLRSWLRIAPIPG